MFFALEWKNAADEMATQLVASLNRMPGPQAAWSGLVASGFDLVQEGGGSKDSRNPEAFLKGSTLVRSTSRRLAAS